MAPPSPKSPATSSPAATAAPAPSALAELDNDLTYTASQLDRDVVSEPQMRLVIQTFRDHLYTKIFPGRTEVPKTLVFAKTDLHADDIVKVIREDLRQGQRLLPEDHLQNDRQETR